MTAGLTSTIVRRACRTSYWEDWQRPVSWDEAAAMMHGLILRTVHSGCPLRRAGRRVCGPTGLRHLRVGCLDPSSPHGARRCSVSSQCHASGQRGASHCDKPEARSSCSVDPGYAARRTFDVPLRRESTPYLECRSQEQQPHAKRYRRDRIAYVHPASLSDTWRI